MVTTHAGSAVGRGCEREQRTALIHLAECRNQTPAEFWLGSGFRVADNQPGTRSVDPERWNGYISERHSSLIDGEAQRYGSEPQNGYCRMRTLWT